MQLTCNINQPEAIRRGFNPSSTAKIEVDVTTLTPRQREILASHFSNGSLTGYSLPQPDIAGLLEVIAEIAEREEKDAAAAKERAERELQAALEILRDRKTRPNSQGFEEIYADRKFNGEFEVCYRFHKDYGKADYRIIEPAFLYGGAPKEIREMEEYKQWLQEIEAINTKAKADAFEKACADLVKKEEKAKVKAEKTAVFKEWALANGSPVLKYRIAEDIDWTALARKEWIDSLGLGNRVPDAEDGYSTDTNDCESPSESEIKHLADVRDALAKLAPGSSAKLVSVTYTNDDDDEDKATTHEIRADINTPDGSTETVWLHA